MLCEADQCEIGCGPEDPQHAILYDVFHKEPLYQAWEGEAASEDEWEPICKSKGFTKHADVTIKG